MTLVIDGKEFTLVQKQRSGLAVYRSGDVYARVGNAERIAHDVTTHKEMEARGFPVAGIVETGTVDGNAYVIERSLGEKTFRTLFEEDITRGGVISNDRFAEFLGIVKRYLEVQVKARVPSNAAAFAYGIHLDIIRTELPQFEISLGQKFDRVLQRLSDMPFVYSHGDFNASNILPLGVIDLEDAFPAPFGFDALCPITTIDWFPDGSEYEYFARYRFTPAQRDEYFALCDDISRVAGLPAISPHFAEYEFCRAVWSCVRMHEWPKLQAWRYEKFIRAYLYN